MEDTLTNKSNIGKKIFSGVLEVPNGVDINIVRFIKKEGSRESLIALNNSSQLTINISNKLQFPIVVVVVR